MTYYTSSQMLVYFCDDIARTEYTGNNSMWWSASFLRFSTNSLRHLLHLQIIILLLILSPFLHRQKHHRVALLLFVHRVETLFFDLLASARRNNVTHKGVPLVFNDSAIVRIIFQQRRPTVTFAKHNFW